MSYPGLRSDRYHNLAARYCPKGAGAVFTFGLKGGYEAGVKLVLRFAYRPNANYEGEPVYRDGAVVGYVTSAGYGYSVGRSIAYAWLPPGLSEEGRQVEIEYFGERHGAAVAGGALDLVGRGARKLQRQRRIERVVAPVERQAHRGRRLGEELDLAAGRAQEAGQPRRSRPRIIRPRCLPYDPACGLVPASIVPGPVKRSCLK